MHMGENVERKGERIFPKKYSKMPKIVSSEISESGGPNRLLVHFLRLGDLCAGSDMMRSAILSFSCLILLTYLKALLDFD